MKGQRKFYAVISKGRRYLHGVFPFSPEGKQKAEEYVKELGKGNKDEFEIIEK